MNTPLDLVVAHFYEHSDKIRMLYSADSEFRSLCEDYYMSRENVDRIREAILETRQDELEFEHLSFALEKEILQYVRRVK
jgi:hypothetical protein